MKYIILKVLKKIIKINNFGYIKGDNKAYGNFYLAQPVETQSFFIGNIVSETLNREKP